MTGTIAGTEATLCRILANVLELEPVDPGDVFFEVGGDSVRAVQVVARAREAGLVFSVRDLFDHQTAGSLAAVIDGRPAATAEAGAPATEPLPTFTDDEFGEFEDEDDEDDAHLDGVVAGGAEAEWETFT